MNRSDTHQGDGTALLGLRRHMANHESVRAAAEATVGDEGTVIAQARAHDGAGGGEHLRHARAALGALVPDHNHRTLHNQKSLKSNWKSDLHLGNRVVLIFSVQAIWSPKVGGVRAELVDPVALWPCGEDSIFYVMKCISCNAL